MESPRAGRGRWPSTAAAIGLVGCLLTYQTSQAQTCHREVPATATAGATRDIRTPHFLIHTDLPLEEAHRLGVRLERMLVLISSYWDRPMRGVIECFVVRDIDTFPLAAMDPVGIRAIRTAGGMNVMRTATDGERYLAKSIVYADERPEVVLHEVVHAYCHHSFGRIGPVWYSEGMAEMGHYWNDGDTTVRADPREIKYLRGSPANMLAETITPHQLTGDCWQNYASRWALCHFLVHSPNYSTQFSRFGRGLLTGRDISFGQTYGDVASELTFEYRFFLEHLGAGYCVQRTAWDWTKRFGALRTGRTVNTTISAGRGWQPSGLTVLSGAQYQYAASGLCSIDGGGRIVDADGDARGRGRLVGVLLDNYQLGSEFELGTLGAFEAPASGNLYLRCRNAWSELGTDSGRLAVRLQLQRQGFRE